MLYRTNTTRQHSQLAYKVRCYPRHALSEFARRLIVWSKHFVSTKAAILDHCDETLTRLFHEGREYHIVWAYGNIPTDVEWDKLTDKTSIDVSLRVSPAIPEGAVAVLSLSFNPTNAAWQHI